MFIVKVIFSTFEDVLEHSKLVVKFTKSYSAAAHEICYDTNQSAPRLFGMSTLPGGWKMVVMEYLNAESFQQISDNNDHHAKLKVALDALHFHNLVHGDVRKCNVLVNDRDARVCLYDFDWSGEEGEQLYPPFMNHEDII